MIEHINPEQANELTSEELPEPASATDKLCEYIVRQQRVEAEQAAAAAQRRSAFYDLSNDAT